MSAFEMLGQAQMLLGEANRQMASTLMDGTRRAMRRLGGFLAEALRHAPGGHPFP